VPGFSQDFVVKTQVENDDGGNPEQEKQRFHGVTSRPVERQVTTISV
jgi:hypothetical protein